MMQYFSFSYLCSLFLYNHCLLLRFLCFLMKHLKVLWKYNPFTGKVIVAHNGSIRKACGTEKWANPDRFCVSEECPDSYRLQLHWDTSAVEIFYLKNDYLRKSIYICISICMCACMYIQKRICHKYQTHTHMGNIPEVREAEFEQDCSVCIITSMLNNLLQQGAQLYFRYFTKNNV